MTACKPLYSEASWPAAHCVVISVFRASCRGQERGIFLMYIIVLALGFDWKTRLLPLAIGLWLSESLSLGLRMFDDQVAMLGAFLSVSLCLRISLETILQRGKPSRYAVIARYLAQTWHRPFHARFGWGSTLEEETDNQTRSRTNHVTW